ncbi:Rep family protein, partial [Lysinibacillus xylanilyticus]
MTAQKKDERTKTWTFVIYPESAPENWREIIGEEHTPWVESPLHDKDVNADGEVKKPHWHVLMMYNSKKSFNQIKRLTDELNAPIPQ